MAFNKVGVILLVFVCGAILLGGNNLKIVVADKICPDICFDAAYMTCPSSGDQHLTPECNCCFASSGCTLYSEDGTSICTAT
ncbi:Proteinase inhibitor PSI-1.2 [Spatholobus suberectus]|nr:Proteinase inhibitor PSI-1.2 [Spatholobus suberectus]